MTLLYILFEKSKSKFAMLSCVCNLEDEHEKSPMSLSLWRSAHWGKHRKRIFSFKMTHLAHPSALLDLKSNAVQSIVDLLFRDRLDLIDRGDILYVVQLNLALLEQLNLALGCLFKSRLVFLHHE